MTNHIKLALKVLGRRKFFTFISLFGISLTLVVLMVATAIADNFFSPRSPESRFDRALCVYRISTTGPHDSESQEPGFAFIEQYVKTLPFTERVGVFSNAQDTAIYKNNARIDTTVKRADGAYWQILDFHFLEGRPFTAQEDDGGALVAVLTDSMRDKLFGGPALGKTFTLEGQSFRVVGVVPRVSLTRVAAYSDIWVPIGSIPSSGYRHELMGGFNAIVLAHSANDFGRMRESFREKLRSYPLDRSRFDHVNVFLDTPYEALARLITPWNKVADGARAALSVTFALVGLALLFMTLPALNLITLNLSRILERASEIGVRKAFGASRPVLIRQFIIENIILTTLGGIIGFVLSVIALRALTSSGVIPNAQFDVNFRIFAYAMFIAVFFGLFSGVYPAWRMSRLDPVNALRGGAQ